MWGWISYDPELDLIEKGCRSSDIDATRTPAWTVERWLAERVLARLPGGR